MGTRAVMKCILKGSLKTAPSSFRIALLLDHLILISFQTASHWNSWHLNCSLAGNKLKKSHKWLRTHWITTTFYFPLSKWYARRFINFHHNIAFPQGKTVYFLEACRNDYRNVVFNNENHFFLVQKFQASVSHISFPNKNWQTTRIY